MNRVAGTVVAVACAAATVGTASRRAEPVRVSPQWNARAAADYLDARERWFLAWPNAARDHGTACISCHTALPYALARPALAAVLHEPAPSAPERTLLDHVVKRVRLWNEVEPFYSDQTRGLPKTSESRGTESVLDALIIARRDARTGVLSDDARSAFEHMWTLQMRTGDQIGGWAWLNFHNEPWEGDSSPYFGASLAAVAAGSAPDGYASSPQVSAPLDLLREYLRRHADGAPLLSRAMGLWASGILAGVFDRTEQGAIVEALVGCQHEDGGWSSSRLGTWPRRDGSAAASGSDGFATGVVVLALERAADPRADAAVARGLAWLAKHQDPRDGHWSATSFNLDRDPASAAAAFMSDAATAYAALALAGG